MPEFYVVYTGDKNVPKMVSLKKDFFRNDLCPIDLEARVFNAEADDIIGQYIVFCHVMDEQIRKHGRKKESAIEAIRICRDRDALREYLNEREKEVVDIMVTLFDQEYAVKQYGITMKEEGREEGRKEGKKEGWEEQRKASEERDRRRVWKMHERGKSVSEIADDMEIGIDTVQKWINGPKPA